MSTELPPSSDSEEQAKEDARLLISSLLGQDAVSPDDINELRSITDHINPNHLAGLIREFTAHGMAPKRLANLKELTRAVLPVVEDDYSFRPLRGDNT
jgi:hypothetical protein